MGFVVIVSVSRTGEIRESPPVKAEAAYQEVEAGKTDENGGAHKVIRPATDEELRAHGLLA